jgi:hypothetical protein
MEAASGSRDGVAASVSVNCGTIQIHVGAGWDAATTEVLLVGYLREATAPIVRGENSGRTLKESNIVLWLHEMGRWNGKPLELEMSVSRLPENVSDIAMLVQSTVMPRFLVRSHYRFGNSQALQSSNLEAAIALKDRTRRNRFRRIHR